MKYFFHCFLPSFRNINALFVGVKFHIHKWNKSWQPQNRKISENLNPAYKPFPLKSKQFATLPQSNNNKSSAINNNKTSTATRFPSSYFVHTRFNLRYSELKARNGNDAIIIN